MKSPNPKLKKALEAVAANPVLKHIRKIAYSPITITNPYKKDIALIQAAEEKRLRKQQKRLDAREKQK